MAEELVVLYTDAVVFSAACAHLNNGAMMDCATSITSTTRFPPQAVGVLKSNLVFNRILLYVETQSTHAVDTI